MRRLFFSSVSLAVLRATAVIAAVSLAPLAMSAQSKTPRTPWGDPDLQGVWSTAAEMSAPFERPATFGDRQFLTDAEYEQRLKQVNEPGGVFAGQATDPPSHWIERTEASRRTGLVIDPPDGRVPASTAEARQRQAATPRAFSNGPFDGPQQMSLWERCITRGGMPGVMLPTVYNANARIVQGPGFVAITYEMIHDTRIIPTDGRPPLGAGVRQYLGDSRGRWEGDTLVVEVTNFTDKSHYRGSSEGLRLTERFRRTAANLINYEVTMNNPRTWARPWTFALDMRQRGETDLFEYACHEGNYAMVNVLKISRAADPK